MKRMLINATQSEEVRLAMVDGQKLLNFEIEHYGREQRKGNIYKATITRIEPSLEACFVDYGEERQGFLPFKEISRQYFAPSDTPIGQIKINEAVEVGQQLIVQVEKEERGNKNAALTTFISLAGRYLVLMPNKPRSGGISRRVEGDERQELRTAMNELSHPRGTSIIARTAGIGRAANELQWDLDYLLGLWKAISDAADAGEGSFLIYNESALVIRAIRDYYTSDIKEILVDTENFYNQARQFMAHIMPDDADKVKFYQDDTPLFARFQIEKQIESAYSREIKLPSGGSIVLDHTEALVAVDVNSARATKGADIEDTATNTNLEAADEIARQLRLRDLGGLIVIDFIDMEEEENRQEVENRLRQALKQDRARVQYSNISRFGLLELSRQRLRPALFEGASISCPRCNGTGHIRDTESTSLQILRRIQEEALKGDTAVIKIQVPVDVASYLLNKKREELTKIEMNNDINVLLIPNKQLETPNYLFERLKEDNPQLENLQNIYALNERVEDAEVSISKPEQKVSRQEPVIKSYMPATAPTPAHEAPKKKYEDAPRREREKKAANPGFLGWIKSLFVSDDDEVKAEKDTHNRRDRNSSRRKSSSRDGKDERRSSDRRKDSQENSRESSRNRRSTSSKGEERKNERSERTQRTERNERNEHTERSERQNRSSENRTDEARNTDNSRQRNSRRNRQQSEDIDNTAVESKPTRATQQRRGRKKPESTEEQTVVSASAVTVAEQVSKAHQAAPQKDAAMHKPLQQRAENEPQAVAVPEAPMADESEEEQNGRQSRSRRTRDRYGRDRRQRNGRSEEQAEATQTTTAPEITAGIAAVAAFDVTQQPQEKTPVEQLDRPAAAEPEPVQQQAAQQAKPVEHMQENLNFGTDAPVQKQTAVETQPPATALPESQPDQAAASATTKAAYTLPVNELESVAKSVGLEWVSTDSALAEKMQETLQNTPKPVMGRKMASPVHKNEPEALVIVETQRTLTPEPRPDHE